MLLFGLLSPSFFLESKAQGWSNVGTGVGGVPAPTIPSVFGMAVYNDELYVGGYFGTAGGKPARNIAKWDGIRWDTVGAGFDDAVEPVIVYNNELYAGGHFDSSGHTVVNHIAKWNGSKWIA